MGMEFIGLVFIGSGLALAAKGFCYHCPFSKHAKETASKHG